MNNLANSINPLYIYIFSTVMGLATVYFGLRFLTGRRTRDLLFSIAILGIALAVLIAGAVNYG